MVFLDDSDLKDTFLPRLFPAFDNRRDELLLSFILQPGDDAARLMAFLICHDDTVCSSRRPTLRGAS